MIQKHLETRTHPEQYADILMRRRIATTFATIFNCWPIYWSWLNSLSPAPYCINYNIFWLVAGIIEEIFDLIIIILPIKQVMDLQLSPQKKLGVMSVFLIGACGIITGIVKVVEGWAPGKRSPHWDKTEIWSSVHGTIISKTNFCKRGIDIEE